MFKPKGLETGILTDIWRVLSHQTDMLTHICEGFLTFWSLTTCVYIYIYMSYHSANLQTLHFKYLFNKYTYWIF